MSADDRPTLLAIQHVPWEGPHRILDACAGLRVRTVKPLAGQELPAPGEVAGAVVMGGPMNVDEVERFPALAAEREWLAEAVGRELPVLGVCLGAQLLARALGAEVRPGPAPEVGFGPVEVHDADDPVLGGLAPRRRGPALARRRPRPSRGATRLAASERTEVQAFRHGSAWGVLFHPEADYALVESWLGGRGDVRRGAGGDRRGRRRRPARPAPRRSSPSWSTALSPASRPSPPWSPIAWLLSPLSEDRRTTSRRAGHGHRSRGSFVRPVRTKDRDLEGWGTGLMEGVQGRGGVQ